MVFEKYKARRACAKELKSYSLRELELEHRKLRNPLPPSYEELYKNSSNESSREASPHSPQRPASFSSSSSIASSHR